MYLVNLALIEPAGRFARYCREVCAVLLIGRKVLFIGKSLVCSKTITDTHIAQAAVELEFEQYAKQSFPVAFKLMGEGSVQVFSYPDFMVPEFLSPGFNGKACPAIDIPAYFDLFE